MRVLMLVIRYDVDDWATNFIPKWVAKLAEHVAWVDVLALEVGNPGDLPSNVSVFSMGKAQGASRTQVLLGFYRQATKLIQQCDAVFVHMIPRYALLIAPLAIPQRKPITLWYTHRNPSRDLKLALPLVKQAVTAVDSSFPLKTDKLTVLGHGIDANFFSPAATPTPTDTAHIVQVARVQPIKRQDVLINAMSHLPENTHAVIVGSVPEGEDPAYFNKLQSMVGKQSNVLSARVTFTGGLPAAAVRDWYRRATVAVNLSPPGLFDKAPLESMAVGVPTIVTNPAFDPLLGQWRSLLRSSDPPDPNELAERIQALMALTTAERAAIGQTLQANVRSAHSLDELIPRLVDVLSQSRKK